MRYSLGPYRWVNDPAIGPHFAPPIGAVGCVDLATLAEMATPGSDRSVGFFASNDPLGSDYQEIGNGDLRELKPGAAVQDAFDSLVGHRPAGVTLVDMLWDCLTNGSDPDGLLAPKPLVPGIDGNLDLHLGGHSIVKREAFKWGAHSHTTKLKQLVRAEMASYFADDSAKRSSKPNQHRRILDATCKKYGVEDWREFVPEKLQGAFKGPELHETVIHDTFNRANQTGLGTASDGFTYATVTGTSPNIVLNAAVSAASNSSSRAESDLSSSDMYAQIVATTGTQVFSARVRFATSANTNYQFNYRGDNTGNLFKVVTGTATTISTASITFVNGHTAKISSNGSTISGFDNGVSVNTVTDTSISGNTRTGFSASIALVFDDFEAGDLFLGSPWYYNQLLRAG